MLILILFTSCHCRSRDQSWDLCVERREWIWVTRGMWIDSQIMVDYMWELREERRNDFWVLGLGQQMGGWWHHLLRRRRFCGKDVIIWDGADQSSVALFFSLLKYKSLLSVGRSKNKIKTAECFSSSSVIEHPRHHNILSWKHPLFGSLAPELQSSLRLSNAPYFLQTQDLLLSPTRV